MIFKTFKSLKYKRTYIGGSKKRELEIFNNVQGNDINNSECDWIEYRRILTQYFDDTLNILLSWKRLTKNIGYFLAFVSIILIKISLPIAIIIFIISIILQILSSYFHFKEKKKLCEYDFSLNIVLSEIKKQTGLELSKN